MPASGPVIIRSSPSIRLTRVDLPALGRPTMARFSGPRPPPLRQLDLAVLDMRQKRLEQIGDALAMLGADRDRLAEAEAIGLKAPASPARPSALLATTTTGVDPRAASGRSPRPAASRPRGRRS